MPKSDTKSVLKGAGMVLRDARLEVPKHQRPFEWKDYQVQELFDDLGTAFDERAGEYFLGSIVVIASKGEKDWHEVLDGQQRLATLSLLFAAIEAEFAGRSDTKRAHEVSQYLTSFDMKSGTGVPRFRLSEQDDDYFRTLLAHTYAPPTASGFESHQRLFGARQSAERWLEGKLKTQRNATDWLTQFTEFLKEDVYVIYFTVSDDANAYLIFETLNDRGLELSIADLLKNYLLGRSGKHSAQTLEIWKRTVTTLSAHRQEHLFTVFLRHLWSSKYAVVREKDLYKEIKKEIKNETQVRNFAQLLEKESFLYSAILLPDHEYWTSKRARNLMRTLSELGLEQYRPLLLAALGVFENRTSEVEELLRKLISWNVRLLVVGGGGGGVMERNYSELARELRAGKLKNVSDIAKRARSFVPSDSAFEASFAVARVANATLARYYLRALERQAGGQAQPEYIANDDPSELNLEHVLPERPEKNWPQFDDDERREYTKRLGNMALLTQKLNSKLRSSPFSKKREYFRTAKLKLTSEVGRRNAWTTAAITSRQNKLAKLAVATWPL